jgi:hypothetical protein
MRTAVRPRNKRRYVKVYVDVSDEAEYGGELDVCGEERQGGTAARDEARQRAAGQRWRIRQ